MLVSSGDEGDEGDITVTPPSLLLPARCLIHRALAKPAAGIAAEISDAIFPIYSAI